MSYIANVYATYVANKRVFPYVANKRVFPLFWILFFNIAIQLRMAVIWKLRIVSKNIFRNRQWEFIRVNYSEVPGFTLGSESF